MQQAAKLSYREDLRNHTLNTSQSNRSVLLLHPVRRADKCAQPEAGDVVEFAAVQHHFSRSALDLSLNTLNQVVRSLGVEFP